MNKQDPQQSLAIVAGVRTPFCRAGTDLKGAAAADLATHVFREVLDRTGVDRKAIDEVILGCAGPDAKEANVARVAALRAGVPQAVPALTVMRNCASGMEALLVAEQKLRAGEGRTFLVGGSEAMSNFPLLMGAQLVKFFTRLQKARSPLQKLLALLRFRPRSLAPRVAVVEGLTDPVSGMIMGNTAEVIARQFDVDRQAMDRFALRSHQRAAAAQQAGWLAHEIAPLPAPPRFGEWVADDNGVRKDQSMDALARLKPIFDRHNGDVTVGNSCQLTDGAVAMLCTSEANAKALGLQPLAVLRGHATVGLAPERMGLGPAFAMPRALAQAGLGLQDIDLFEINEAFAAQVLACNAALASDGFCRNELGLEGALGAIDPGKLNVNGGAIALGHPIAASGARLPLTLAHELRRRGKRFGVASLCIGGGQGQAIVLEAV